ncbi:MAG: DUF2934 domain-containing protein [Phycisphaerales bacterium]
MTEIEVDRQAPADARPLTERIAERAYEIWQSRGGDERSNWLEAERQILAEATA